VKPQVALPTLLAAMALAVLGLFGCGGSGSGGTSGTSSSATPAELVSQTFGSNAKVRSGRLTVALDADVKGTTQPVKLELTGPFSSSGDPRQIPSFDLTLTVTSDGKTEEYGATSTGDKGFLKYQGTEYAVPDQLFRQFADRYAQAQRQAAGRRKGATTLRALGIDPRNWLTDPRVVGDADVGGTDTVHVTAGIAVPKLLRDVQSLAARAGSVAGAQGFSQADRQKLQKSVRSATFDFFTGKDDKRLRKLVLDVALTTGHIRLTLQYDHLDEPQDISAPADAKPLTGLGALLQGAASGGSQPAAPAGSANERYLQCVQQAGQDIAKYQACAKYL
jgi:hypothetical protein